MERCVVYCETCGKPFDLNAEGVEIMPCEVCLEAFCPDCFIKRHGKETFDRMVNEGEYYACPDCFPKYKHEIFKTREE